MSAEDGRAPVSLRDYVRLLRRRKWVFILTVLAVPALAIALSLRSPASYQASSKVLLTEQSAVGGTQSFADPARAAQTQADLARTQQIVRDAVAKAHVAGLTPDMLMTRSTVVASLGSDFLTFSVTDTSPSVANRLAMAYAHAYVDYRYKLDTQALQRARALAERQKKQLEASGLGNSAAHRSVEQQLAAIDGTQVPALAVLQTSDQPAKIGPRVKRNGGIALVLGLVLGLGLAFLWDVLDTRVRSIDTIRNALPRVPLLARLPAPARALRKRDGLVMVSAPTSAEAEPVRVLRANFEFAVRDVGAKTIIFTSGVGGEGKSTTVANLAVALARAGRRVALIDFDLRNPGLHRFFGLRGTRGLIDVVLGEADIEDVLTQIPLTDVEGQERRSQQATDRLGSLEVLTLGRALRDPDQIRADVVARKVVDQVADRADFVLIDAGPLLPTGDTIALSAHADGLVLVVRLNVLPLSGLDDLERVLGSSPAAKIGFVVTSAEETLRPSQHSGSGRRGELLGRRGSTNGDSHKNGSSAMPDPEEQPYAAEY